MSKNGFLKKVLEKYIENRPLNDNALNRKKKNFTIVTEKNIFIKNYLEF